MKVGSSFASWAVFAALAPCSCAPPAPATPTLPSPPHPVVPLDPAETLDAVTLETAFSGALVRVRALPLPRLFDAYAAAVVDLDAQPDCPTITRNEVDDDGYAAVGWRDSCTRADGKTFDGDALLEGGSDIVSENVVTNMKSLMFYGRIDGLEASITAVQKTQTYLDRVEYDMEVVGSSTVPGDVDPLLSGQQAPSVRAAATVESEWVTFEVDGAVTVDTMVVDLLEVQVERYTPTNVTCIIGTVSVRAASGTWTTLRFADANAEDSDNGRCNCALVFDGNGAPAGDVCFDASALLNWEAPW